MDHPEEEEYNENLPSSAHLHRGASPGRLPLRAQPQPVSNPIPGGAEGTETLSAQKKPSKQYKKKCNSEGCTSNSRGKEGLCVRHGAYLTGPDDIEDEKLKQIVANAILGDVGELFSIEDEVSYLHFFILIIF